MKSWTPEDLMDRLVQKRSVGDVEAALSCYEQEATIATAPGLVASGTESIRAVLDYFAASEATFAVERRTFMGSPDIALHRSRWTLQGLDPSGQGLQASGLSTDVLRRQADGSWLITIDNPWGSELSDPTLPKGETDD